MPFPAWYRYPAILSIPFLIGSCGSLFSGEEGDGFCRDGQLDVVTGYWTYDAHNRLTSSRGVYGKGYEESSLSITYSEGGKVEEKRCIGGSPCVSSCWIEERDSIRNVNRQYSCPPGKHLLQFTEFDDQDHLLAGYTLSVDSTFKMVSRGEFDTAANTSRHYRLVGAEWKLYFETRYLADGRKDEEKVYLNDGEPPSHHSYRYSDSYEDRRRLVEGKIVMVYRGYYDNRKNIVKSVGCILSP